MKSFTTLQEEYEWHQEHLPGGPGYDDNPDRDDDWEEERKERMLDLAIERQERRRESKWD
jgi:hypothetical protein